MKKKLYFSIVAVLGLVIAIYYLGSINSNSDREVIEAQSAQVSLSSQNDWELGTNNNTDLSTASGSIKINSKAVSEIDLISIYAENPSSITTNINSGSAASLLDNDPVDGDDVVMPEAGWSDYGGVVGGEYWWQMDLGQNYLIKSLGIYGEILPIPDGQPTDNFPNVYTSTNGIDYTWRCQAGMAMAWYPCAFSGDTSTRYIKIVTTLAAQSQPSQYFCVLHEIMAHQGGNATHRSQTIDGGENFWSWDENTITQTTPANTSTAFRYRTSSNGSDWTAWVGDIGSVTNRTGDDDNNPTRYRYLQIEATLTNTDGVSTPTIDSYDIDYHTEVKPGVPTAQTAVVQ